MSSRHRIRDTVCSREIKGISDMMKLQVLLGTAVLALASFGIPARAADVEPPPAEEAVSPFSAHAEGWIGYWFVDGEKENVVPDEDEGFLYGVSGKARLDLFSGLSVQGDLSYEDVDENDGDDYYQGSWLGGGHLSWSNSDSGLLGVFGGTGSADSDEQETDFWFIGGEGQLYLENWTLYGQAGYFDGEVDEGEPDDAVHNAWFGRAVGRYFVSPHSRVQAEIAYLSGDQDADDDDMEIVSWGARFDHQFWEGIGVFAAYDGGYYESNDEGLAGAYYDHVVRAGLSIAFGRSDLLEADRSGPNLDMPAVGRWGASGNIVD